MSSADHMQTGHGSWRRRVNTTMTVFGAAGLAALGVCGGLGSSLSGPHQSEPPARRIPILAVDTSTPQGAGTSQVTSTTEGAGTSQGTGTPEGAGSSQGTGKAQTTGTSQLPATPQQRSAPTAQTPSAAETAPLSATDQQLIGALPPGYGTNSCQPVTPPVTGAVSTVDCLNNSNGGPPSARYSLFADPQTLENSFATITFNDVAHQTCPDGAASPGSWHFNVPQEHTTGSLLCGIDSTNNTAALGWTDEGALMLAVAEGPNLDALYGWWQRSDPSDPNAGRVAFS